MKDRILEVAICIEAFIILVLICIVVYFITNYTYNIYDVDRDGEVTITDVTKVLNYYLYEN